MICLTSTALFEPEYLSDPAPWAGHIPFAAWLIKKQKPQCFVELGTYSGISYLTFCQAIHDQNLSTKAYAIDTWKGDAHAGFYDEKVYESLKILHDLKYPAFSTLLRMTFDEALPRFKDGSIDLLHIDGLHTYEAVRHDFENWFPKISQRGIVLFHDTNVFQKNFGVHRLWSEIKNLYPSIQFMHSHGLGVLLVGSDQPLELLELCSPNQMAEVCKTFAAFGKRFELKTRIMSFEHKLKDALEREHQQSLASEARHQWILQQDEIIRQYEIQLNHITQASEDQGQLILRQNETIHHQEIRLQQQIDLITNQEITLQQQIHTIHSLTEQLELIKKQLNENERQIDEIYRSNSWRITTGLRFIGKASRKQIHLLQRFRNGIGYIARGDWKALKKRISTLRHENIVNKRFEQLEPDDRHVGIITVPHTLFVAHAMLIALQEAGFQVTLYTKEPKDFILNTYFILCPQMFRRLPPGEKRIVFQMEQSVNSRWFTSEYFKVLENSLAVFDYSLVNLKAMEKRGIVYPHTYFVPIGGIVNYSKFLQANGAIDQNDDACDVLFYGDPNIPRRQKLLNILKQHFKIRIVSNLFGAELHRILINTQVVVNIHYYEGALLETTRIYECLSLGIAVVSEISSDISEHLALRDVVDFVPPDNAEELISAVANALSQKRKQQLALAFNNKTQNEIERSAQYFRFMLYRALYSLRILSHQQWDQLSINFPPLGQKIALSLPEITSRRAAYLSINQPDNTTIFDGIRYQPGWIGCALSYKYLAKKALAAGLAQIEIMEDDVLFLDSYHDRRRIVDSWLAENCDKWDIFAGLIADVHKGTKILNVTRYNGLRFVTINRMTSMVYNIYSQNSLHLLAKWDPSNIDPHTNTIDRFLQANSNLRIVVVLPFLINHREDVNSSLWGFNNSQYSELIKEAERILLEMSEEFTKTPLES